MRIPVGIGLPIVVGLLSVGVLGSCVGSGESSRESAAVGQSEVLALSVKVLDRYLHDPVAFTQGLEWYTDSLYESTGLRGQSSIRRVDPKTGEVQQKHDLPPELFGEGLARVGNRLIQLTYKAGLAIIYDIETFEQLGELSYTGEGWGLCFDGQELFMSDGSDTLTVRDPNSFNVIRKIVVQLHGRQLSGLNELECAQGWIYANIYQTNTIIRVEGLTGQVRATIDASGLLSSSELGSAGVLNGIAYNSGAETFMLTGKNWPALFEVIFVEQSPSNR